VILHQNNNHLTARKTSVTGGTDVTKSKSKMYYCRPKTQDRISAADGWFSHRFCAKLLTDRQTSKQRQLHILGGVNYYGRPA